MTPPSWFFPTKKNEEEKDASSRVGDIFSVVVAVAVFVVVVVAVAVATFLLWLLLLLLLLLMLLIHKQNNNNYTATSSNRMLSILNCSLKFKFNTVINYKI